MEINSGKKYLVIFFVVALLLLFFVNLYSYERLSGLEENRRQKYITEFQLQKNILEYRLEDMFASTYLERKLIEKYLINNEDTLINDEFDYIINEEQNKGITTIILNSGSESGNIVLPQNYAEQIDLENNQQFKKLIQLLPIRHLLIKDEEFVEWSVFYTENYFSTAPDIELEMIEDPILIFDSVKYSLEAINNENKDLYQDGWQTSVFKDQSGQQLLFSKNLPLKIDDQYIAILSSNISIDHLKKFINQSPEVEIYITNSYNDIVYADGRELDQVISVDDYFSENLIEKLKFDREIKFTDFEGENYLSSSLAVGDWNLIYHFKTPLVNLSRFYSELIFSNLMILAFIAVIFKLLRKNIKLEAEKRKILHQEANHDELTGLYNKKMFFKQAQIIFNNAARGNINFALVMIDLDDFKEVNDSYGHLAGDYVLQETARIIKENSRSTDLAARFGGEEFCLLLTGANKDNVFNKIEQIRKKISEKEFSYKNKNIKVTISAGATFKLQDSIKEMIAEADRLLYKSKENGKNQTTIN